MPVAVVIVLGSILLQRIGEAIDPNISAIRASAAGALTALYYDDLPPADYQGGPLPSAAAATIRERVVTDIERYFSPTMQGRYEPMILNALGAIGSSEWDAAGGFSSLDWDRVDVLGDHATLELRTDDWVLRRGGQDGRTPDATHQLESTMDWRFTLIRINGEWRVDSFYGSCLEGCP